MAASDTDTLYGHAIVTGDEFDNAAIRRVVFRLLFHRDFKPLAVNFNHRFFAGACRHSYSDIHWPILTLLCTSRTINMQGIILKIS